DVGSICHQIARKRKTDARRNEPNQSGCDRDILWKTCPLSSKWCLPAMRARKYAWLLAFWQHLTSSGAGAWWRCNERCRRYPKKNRRCPKKKRPVRGDNRTGQSHMGAWGGWALAPNIANGEGIPLPRQISRATPPDVQRPARFFNPRSEGVLVENYCAAGRFGSLVTDLSDAIAAGGIFSSRLTETSLSVSPGLRGAVATGTGGVAVAAVAAANASASP